MFTKPGRSSSACYLLPAGFLLHLIFALEEGGSTFLRNCSEPVPDCTGLYPRRKYSKLELHGVKTYPDVPSQMNPVYILVPYLYTIHFCIIHLFTLRS
jgi:hypothetical protein